MTTLYIVLALIAGIGIDRFVMWDKLRAVTEERMYHVDTIRDLQRRLQKTNMERFAEARERGGNPDPDDLVFLNPDFENQLHQYGRAVTRVARAGTMQRSQRRPQGTPGK